MQETYGRCDQLAANSTPRASECRLALQHRNC